MRLIRPLLAPALLGIAVAALGADSPARAQVGLRRVPGAAPVAPVNRNDPVAFTADEVSYDREHGIVTATGHVEAWQNDHVLRADKITFDRNTNIAAASGNVVVVEPDGQVLFSDYAELTEGMREGVLSGMRALLAENGRLVANGARRTEGKINELSRTVYTTCNLCAKDPSRPPFWELRARSAVQDKANQTIEYRDAVMDMFGIPIAYFPYFSHADPSVRRASGFLIPSFGSTSALGPFLTVPYYWAIDDNSDATIAPTFNTKEYLNVRSEYRRRFNDGTLSIDFSLGYDAGKPQADVFAKGSFAYDDTWRYGFDIERASSAAYLRDYRAPSVANVLSSTVYVEGFGTGSYTRLDSSAYQALVSSLNQNALPYVLPHYQYNFVGEPDWLGGRLSFQTQDFNVIRGIGTNTERVAARLVWERPFLGDFGETYRLVLRNDAAAYSARDLDQQPNYAAVNTNNAVRSQPDMALEMHWPWVREGDAGGSQTIEPIIQFVAGPNTGAGPNHRDIPNEDSLDFEFTDQNLFSINKYPGYDRQEGGLRMNAGLHFNWTTPSGMQFDNLVGQSYRTHKDDTFPVGSGLEDRTSDVVTRTTLTPASWLDLTGRTRIDHQNGSLNFADVVGSTGIDKLRFNVGYIFSRYNPYYFYNSSAPPSDYYQHRNEVTVGVTTKIDEYSLSAYARRDIRLDKMTAVGLRARYENECFILDANFARRYTSLNGDTGGTYVLFQITFKTVGQFGFHAF